MIIRNLYHKLLKKLLPFLIGFIPASIIILLLPNNFEEYAIEFNIFHRHMQWYADLEGDNKKELFGLGEQYNHMILYTYDENGNFLGQTNFKHRVFDVDCMPLPFAIDFDKDEVKDIVLFSQNYDSIFLNIYSFNKNEKLIESKFVTTIGGVNNKTDVRINWIHAQDINSDGTPELYFAISGGFSLKPRKVFRYSFDENHVISTINFGSKPNTFQIKKVNNEWRIFCYAHASGNTSPDYPYPYPDSTCWVFGFNHDLELAFKPLRFGKYPANLYPVYSNKYFQYFVYSSFNTCEKSKIIKIDIDGNIIDSLQLDFHPYGIVNPIKLGDKIYHPVLDSETREYITIDFNDLNIKKSNKLQKFRNKSQLLENDFNGDGQLEYLFKDNIKTYAELYSNNLKQVTKFPLDKEFLRNISISYNNDTDKGKLLMASKKGTKQYYIERNPYYKLKYLVWFGIYLLSVTFIWLLLYFQRKAINKRLKLEKQIAEVQLQNLRNQLDPHFTFNALNSVGKAIYKQDKEQAYKLFQRFTRMIRSSLLVSDKVFRSLDEELQFTRDYLEFQKTRFKELFDYFFEVDENIDLQKIQIPKMFVQSFAENAVKHAFVDLEEGGKIWVKIVNEKQQIKITVEDNGIGISKSKELGTTSGTQKGEALLKTQVAQINRLYGKNIQINIADLHKDQSGTLVSIMLQ